MDASGRNGVRGLNRAVAVLSGLLVVIAGAAQAAAEEGAELFVKNCQTCHTIEKGAAVRAGPNLWGIVGRKAGTIEGFNYSAGLKNSGIVWTAEALDLWLAFPKKMIRDTFMTYRQTKPEIRKAIIDYLATRKD